METWKLDKMFDFFCEVNKLRSSMSIEVNVDSYSISLDGTDRDIVFWAADKSFEVREIKNKCTYIWQTLSFEESLEIAFKMKEIPKKVFI